MVMGIDTKTMEALAEYKRMTRLTEAQKCALEVKRLERYRRAKMDIDVQPQQRSGPSWVTIMGVLLTVLFVGLKLTGYILWSWWWVVSPICFALLWPFALAAILLVFAFFCHCMAELFR